MTPAHKLKQRVVPQGIGVVLVFVAAGDLQEALAQQERNAWSRLAPEVFDAGRSMLAVAPSDASDPVGGIAGDAGNHFGGQPAGQEPEEVPAAALDRIFCTPVASF